MMQSVIANPLFQQTNPVRVRARHRATSRHTHARLVLWPRTYPVRNAFRTCTVSIAVDDAAGRSTSGSGFRRICSDRTTSNLSRHTTLAPAPICAPRIRISCTGTCTRTVIARRHTADYPSDLERAACPLRHLFGIAFLGYSHPQSLPLSKRNRARHNSGACVFIAPPSPLAPLLIVLISSASDFANSFISQSPFAKQ
jgi:hypothetical protein